MILKITLFTLLAAGIVAGREKPLQGKQTRILRSNKYGNSLYKEQKDTEIKSWRGPLLAAMVTQESEPLAAGNASIQELESQDKEANTRSKISEPSVCYGEFGCFGDAYLWDMTNLPNSPQEVGTQFRLYSSGNRSGRPLAVMASNISAACDQASPAVNPTHPTKIIVHGLEGHCDVEWVKNMQYALMAVEECNVICVDWKAGAQMLGVDYSRTVANTRLVGKQIALFLQGLEKRIHLKLEDVHLIGFSLGAHVAGFAGAELKGVGRITGLDPAGPNFNSQDPRAGLDKTDAKFVDVIHTNGKIDGAYTLGLSRPMGHVDFYPNGGSIQPGCPNLILSGVADVMSLSGWTPKVQGLCNHRRAFKLFIDSISPKCRFPAVPCDDYDSFVDGRCSSCKGNRGNMGYYADRSPGRGQLYLLTGENEPFCAHQYHVSVWASSGTGESTNFGQLKLRIHDDFGTSETFPMTMTQETSYGSAHFTQVIVPQQILGVPLRVSLIYTAYDIKDILRNIFMNNARSIHIHKLIVTDLLTARTSSLCIKGTRSILRNSMKMQLNPGDCTSEEDEALLNEISSNELLG